MELIKDLNKGSEDALRMNIHGPKVQETLTNFKERIKNYKLDMIEILILECFQKLLNKNNFIHQIHIDKESSELFLLDEREELLDPKKLSAGERQLLAVSIIWALSKASQKKLPTIIDTPLGRLDSNHRQNLVSNYFPFAGEQVLLLSTDEEIDEKHKNNLSQYIAHSYLLKFDNTTQTTSVQEGYFV